jgi:large subunit ribosomal protein L10
MTETYQVKVKPEKAAAVEAIRAELEASAAAVVTEYRGLTVEELKVLRSRLAEQDTTYRVTKKTLARRAANELGLDLESVLEGPIAIAYVKGDSVAAAKVIATFAKEHPALVIKASVLDGKVLSDQQTKDLATVDPLDVSLAKIMGLLTAPLQATMMLLEAPAARIIFVLEELGKREGGAEVSSEAPAPDGPEAVTESPDVPDVQAQPEPEAEAVPPAEPQAEQAEEVVDATDETESKEEGE